MIDFGRSGSGTNDGLYTKTVDRAAIPTQLSVDGLKLAGTCATVAASTGANRPAFSTMFIPGEFSVRNTSAGEPDPSADQLVRQFGVATVAHLDLDAGRLGERLRPRLGQILVLRVVHHQPTRAGAHQFRFRGRRG